MIRISTDYIVDVDPNCYTLKRDTHKNDKTGKPIYTPISYHSNLEQALMAYSNCRIKGCLSIGEITVMDAVGIIKREYRELYDALKRIETGGNNA